MPERGGVWSTGERAEVALPPFEVRAVPVTLWVRAAAYLHRARPERTVGVRVNGVAIGQLDFDRAGLLDRRVDLPAGLLTGRGDDCLEVEIDAPESPYDAEGLPDGRRLGIHLAKLTILEGRRDPATDAPGD